MRNEMHEQCPYAERIISYIYDEMLAAESPAFEQHLSRCQVCTDDFAAISEARFEVFDWKRLEFDELATPAINIPYREPRQSLAERLSGWVAWTTAVPAFGLILLAAGIGFMLLNRQPPAVDDVAVSQSNVNVASPVAAPSLAETTSKASVQPPGGVFTTAKMLGTKREPSRRVGSPPQYAKHVSPRVRLSSDVALNLPIEKPKKLPRLGVQDDEDDMSLRLAELFDEAEPPQDE